MRAYFVSDLHLKNPDDDRTKAFVSWLGRLARANADAEERATHLFLVGDIFDLWVGSHAYFAVRFRGVVDAIKAVRAAGIEVHYFEGNHDLHLTDFWQDRLGVVVYREAEHFTLSGREVRVEHGDLINPDDKGYRFLRKFLRTGPVTSLLLGLPSAVVGAIGERASRVSRSFHATPEPEAERTDRIRRMIRAHAEREYAKKPFEFIITGHVHVRDDHVLELGAGRPRSINLGSWLERPYRALVLDERGAEFVEIGTES